MAGFVHRIVIGGKVVAFCRKCRGVGEVPAANVVHVPVVVVVNAWPARYFDLVTPDIAGEVFVGIVHAGIDDGDDDVLLTRREPVAQGLPSDLLQAVLLGQAGVVRRVVMEKEVDGLGIDDVRVLGICGGGFRRTYVGVQFEAVNLLESARPFGQNRTPRKHGFGGAGTKSCMQACQVSGSGFGRHCFELDENLSG